LSIKKPGDGVTSPRSCRIGINGNPKVVILVLGWLAVWDKEPRQISKAIPFSTIKPYLDWAN
jgi:hypothetical protein